MDNLPSETPGKPDLGVGHKKKKKERERERRKEYRLIQSHKKK